MMKIKQIRKTLILANPGLGWDPVAPWQKTSRTLAAALLRSLLLADSATAVTKPISNLHIKQASSNVQNG